MTHGFFGREGGVSTGAVAGLQIGQGAGEGGDMLPRPAGNLERATCLRCMVTQQVTQGILVPVGGGGVQHGTAGGQRDAGAWGKLGCHARSLSGRSASTTGSGSDGALPRVRSATSCEAAALVWKP